MIQANPKKHALESLLNLNMGQAQDLRKKFERSISKKILIIAGWGYTVLTAFGFLILSLFLNYYLAGLVNSQSYAIAVQEWRGVANGIKTGWNFYPSLDGICIISGSEVLESQGICPASISIVDKFFGYTTANTQSTFEVRIHFRSSIWLLAILFSIITFAIISLFLLLFRRSFTMKNQLEIVELFDNYDSTKNKLTDFQKMVQTQTEEIVSLKRQAFIAQIASQVSHDI